MAAIFLTAALNWICVVASSNYGATDIQPGRISTCALLEDGNVKCWGGQTHTVLAQGDSVVRGDQPDEMGDFLPPIDLGTGRTAASLTTGPWEYTMCVVLDDGNAKCWGWNAYGQCAIGTSADVGGVGFDGNSPVAKLGAGRTVQQVAGGWYHMCALLDAGTVKCWGWGGETLGYGDSTNRGTNVAELGENLPEVDIGTGKVAKALYSGYGSVCVILTDDSTKCWGKSAETPYGDLVIRGTGPGEMGDNLPTIDFGTGRHATHISMGEGIGCVVLDDGGVKCWGSSNSGGRLGQDITGLTMGDSFPTIDLGTGKVAVQVSTKTQHCCAVFDDGTLKCWGYNGNGELGLGDGMNRGVASSETGFLLKDVIEVTLNNIKNHITIL